MIEFDKYNFSFAQLNDRIERVKAKAAYSEDNINILKNILNCIDLTTLEGNDTQQKAHDLAVKASSFNKINVDFPNVAAVCVYPSLIRIVKQSLQGSDLKAASVAGAFPAGQSSLAVKIAEVKYAIAEGADEIDMVISRGKLMEGLYQEVYDEIAAIKNVCGNIHLKVILETGELPSVQLIRTASALAMNAGADFIKTSTGKIAVGATESAVLIMLDTIQEFHAKTGKAVGIKPSGGIRTTDQALSYYLLTEDVLGPQWLNNRYFRIGASSLADNLVTELLRIKNPKQ